MRADDQFLHAQASYLEISLYHDAYRCLFSSAVSAKENQENVMFPHATKLLLRLGGPKGIRRPREIGRGIENGERARNSRPKNSSDLISVRYVSTTGGPKMVDKEELKKRLTAIQYQVTQEKGTERPFTGCYNKTYDTGTYVCVCCDQPLFSSDTKYDSGCGWPAFNDVLDAGKVKLSPDTSGGLVRTEVTCSKCNAHLGHVFGDGPPPTKKRFCINSASINFVPGNEQSNCES